VLIESVSPISGDAREYVAPRCSDALDWLDVYVGFRCKPQLRDSNPPTFCSVETCGRIRYQAIHQLTCRNAAQQFVKGGSVERCCAAKSGQRGLMPRPVRSSVNCQAAVDCVALRTTLPHDRDHQTLITEHSDCWWQPPGVSWSYGSPGSPCGLTVFDCTGELSCESDRSAWDSHWRVREGGSDVQEQSGRRPQMQRHEGASVLIDGGKHRRLRVVRFIRPHATQPGRSSARCAKSTR